MPDVGDIADPGPRRRYSTRAFPAYRYVPGVRPHPQRDAAGHSYQTSPAARRHQAWRTEDWRTLDEWLFGVDLFNAHYFWEAHEAWEVLWSSVERGSVASLFLQGLIQLAAALLKVHLRSAAGARSLSRTGLEKLRVASASAPQFMGLDVAGVIGEFEAYFEVTNDGALLRLSDAPILQLVI